MNIYVIDIMYVIYIYMSSIQKYSHIDLYIVYNKYISYTYIHIHIRICPAAFFYKSEIFKAEFIQRETRSTSCNSTPQAYFSIFKNLHRITYVWICSQCILIKVNIVSKDYTPKTKIFTKV